MPFKSMPQKSNHDFKEKHTNVRVGTLISIRITDIIGKTAVFCRTPAFQNMSKTHNDVKGKELKIINDDNDVDD